MYGVINHSDFLSNNFMIGKSDLLLQWLKLIELE